MPNFEPVMMDLTAAAKTVLKKVDEGLSLYELRNIKPSQIHLYEKDFAALDRSVRQSSRGHVSLDTHTYRGVKLLRMKK